MPLRLRLALWYGGLAGLVDVLVSLFAYAVHSRAHYDDVDRRLVAAAEHVAEEFAAASTPHERIALFAVPVAPDVAARVYDADGQIVATGPNAVLAPPFDPRAVLVSPAGPAFGFLVGLAPRIAPVGSEHGVFGLASAPDGDRWRFYVLPEGASRQYVTVAAPLGALDASVARFRQLVPVMALLGAVVAFVGGGLVAGSALQPIAALTETASAIARSRGFSRRDPLGRRRDELGRLAVTFNEMLGSLEQAYEAQQRFVADASHELRAPLTAIQANIELLERRDDMPPAERQQAVSELSRESRRLVRLVADLLALARADAGVPLRRDRVELDRVVLDAVADARHLGHGQRIEIGALEPTQIEGDVDRLKQLLIILLDNAVKYTPASGTVTVSLRRAGATAEITVQDTGVGIQPEDLPRVFDRFYRADRGRARDPGGTGLGLPIARWIAQQHGGHIELASTPGQGTTATVRLPVRVSPD